jgi:hypothetical protein
MELHLVEVLVVHLAAVLVVAVVVVVEETKNTAPLIAVVFLLFVICNHEPISQDL